MNPNAGPLPTFENFVTQSRQANEWGEPNVVVDQATCEALAQELETKLKAILPNNLFKAYAKRSLGGGYLVDMTFAVGKDSSEWLNRIFENDPGYMLMQVYGDPKGFSLEIAGRAYTIKKAGIPGLISKKGDHAAIVKHLVTYFIKNGAAINHLGGK